MAGEFQWANWHNIGRWQWSIPNDNMREGLPVRHNPRWFCHQFGDCGCMANGRHKIQRNGGVQLRDQPPKANHLGTVCAAVHREHDPPSDGGCRMVSDGNFAHESLFEYGPWLFGALCAGLLPRSICVVAGEETNVSWLGAYAWPIFDKTQNWRAVLFSAPPPPHLPRVFAQNDQNPR